MFQNVNSLQALHSKSICERSVSTKPNSTSQQCKNLTFIHKSDVFGDRCGYRISEDAFVFYRFFVTFVNQLTKSKPTHFGHHIKFQSCQHTSHTGWHDQQYEFKSFKKDLKMHIFPHVFLLLVMNASSFNLPRFHTITLAS